MNVINTVEKIKNYECKKNLLIEKLSTRFAKLLDDESAHFVMQAGDGFCAVYRDTKNQPLSSNDVNYLLNLTNKDDAYNFLDCGF